MLRRSLRLARAASALGLLTLVLPLAGRAHGDDVTETGLGAGAETRQATVSVLQASRDGSLEFSARGNGEDKVHLTLRNTSARRLNVVLPAGLVASAGSGQFGGFQSMGLGVPTDNAGAFGEFQGAAAGFQAMPTSGQAGLNADIAIAPGQTLELDVPAVCLNFGLPTPTAKNEFRLMEVEEYTQDARARKALRSLATLGTSQKVAQAVAWNVFNGMPFDAIAVRAAKSLNIHEVALAARFVEALDESGASDLVDPAYLEHNRVFLRVQNQGETSEQADQLVADLEGLRLMGLPVQVVENAPSAEAASSAIMVDVTLTMVTPSLAQGRAALSYRTPNGSWKSLGGLDFQTEPEAADSAGLAEALDRSIASTFVKVRTVKRAPGLTTLSVENRLPLTIAHATLLTGEGSGEGEVAAQGIGVGPARTAQVTIPAAKAKVDRIVFNGL